MVLGDWIGVTYMMPEGFEKEIKGGSRKTLAVAPDKKTLVVIADRSVLYVMKGGQMHVSNWIRR